MHASSIENMQKCIDRYLSADFFTSSRKTLVDIGSSDVNGSYRRLFAEDCVDYRGVDLAAGPGVDIVLEDPYHLPFADASVHLVLSGQTFEHCEFFWLLFQEMVRVLTPDGLIFLIAPSAGPIHRFPVDCYRFYPDGFEALAKYSGCHALAVWRDERGPWFDLVGIFSKDPGIAVSSVPRSSAFETQNDPVPAGDPAVEATRGLVNYLEVLSTMHRELAPRAYLEIGVRFGRSLALAECPAIGIDPSPENTERLKESARIYSMTSDTFFDTDAGRINSRELDLAFIDGMHLFEFSLRDFMNIERRAHEASVLVFDDIFPNHPLQASRQRSSRVWTGDVWKIRGCLARYRPDLCLVPLDASPAGLLLVTGLDPGNRVLWNQYNPIVRQYSAAQAGPPSAEVLERTGALDPRAPLLQALLSDIRSARSAANPKREVAIAIKNFRQGG